MVFAIYGSGLAFRSAAFERGERGGASFGQAPWMGVNFCLAGGAKGSLNCRTAKVNLVLPFSYECHYAEEVVQVYGFCIRTLHLPVISVMIIGVMRLSYNERAVPDGRFRHHLFQAVFMRTTYPSRCVYFRWSRVHTAVESAVTAPVGM